MKNLIKEKILYKNRSGLSILEVIISITIIIIGISSVMILFENNFRMQELNMRKLVAYNLAKEGIEIARWQRDSYWFTELSKYKIDWGFTGDEAVIPILEDDNDPLQGWVLKKEGGAVDLGKDEVYIYRDASSNKITYVQSKKPESAVPSSWVRAGYKRKLLINQNNPDGDASTLGDIRIISRVEYAPGKYVELESFLYNWY